MQAILTAEIYKQALEEEKQRKKLGFSTPFEFAVYEELQTVRNDEDSSKNLTNAIFNKVKEETKIVGWKLHRRSKPSLQRSTWKRKCKDI
ncbi:MAG: hypothetical protein JO297_01715 [Nitrososphaeraceae archaeon]|nr:hypothetical protein [Nitrososphaeraceae archaeon]